MNIQPRLCSLILLLACSAPLAMAQTPPARAEQRETKEPQAKQTRKEIDETIDAIRTYSIERRKDAMDRARQATQEMDRGAAELQSCRTSWIEAGIV